MERLLPECLIHASKTTKQASPATYEIQKDENGYYIYNQKRVGIEYDAILDELILSSYGKYMRN
ncbi:DUF3876 domain-containing protein [Dysgonomonas alginatilytica]|uniref:DUF3876 domain-containing protein n=1 Tax=Dysgonomonas alginatilytica TaxID=1605892 RepID=UPI001FE65F88|nr:DUF3876 domain-containing protein [Dysgonomonas alginatilytica]